MYLKTASSSQYKRYFILHLMLRSIALQNNYEHCMTSTYKAEKIRLREGKDTLHPVCSFILDAALFMNTCMLHLLLHSHDITVSPCES